MFEAILFDLDGTLADTAPDLGGAINLLRREEGLPDLPLAALRPYTSQGARGLVGAGFGIDNGHPDYARLATRFLDLYAANLCIDTALFPGMAELLDQIESAGMRWGVVTNKKACFTLPLIAALGLAKRAATVVSGDTTPAAKPSPLPILHACREAGCAPERTLYIGDDARDIAAGRAAGTRTAAVSFGYLGTDAAPDTWGADLIADNTKVLERYIFDR